MLASSYVPRSPSATHYCQPGRHQEDERVRLVEGAPTGVNILGIDPSSKKVATSMLATDGSVDFRIAPVPPALRGAHRLHWIRERMKVQLGAFTDVGMIVVEIPWAPKASSSFVLLSIAGVLMEAAQAAQPGAVVMELPTASWKLRSVGHGNASKGECMEHAIGLGLDRDDQDLADALCMCQAGWEMWAQSKAAG